ncbi:gfo/Idh/MocA family oxidoreductase [Paenibacillaceae bacterium]|nr:gfo/Idh/MocA family oxidoreductase [Paenibacillaceae bacterium]
MNQSMKQPIKIAVLGFAHGHVNAYCKEWVNNPKYGIHVATGWDHDHNRLEQARQWFGLEAKKDVERLLDDPDIQAVVIASETSMHTELIELAASKGKTIIVQKPLALTMAEADRIVKAVTRHGVRFTLAWQMRIDPQNIQMKQMVQEQTLGKVFMIRRRHGLSVGLDPKFADSWHVNPAYNRDIWADDTAHPADFFNWLLGVPESVTAEVESLYNPRIPMDTGIVIYRYKNGPLAEISSSFACAAAENTTEIICEHGTIIQNYGDAVSCNVPRPADAPGLKWYSKLTGQWHTSEWASPPQHSQRIQALAEPLAAFMRGEREPLATAEDGRTSLRMVLASYVSAREGRRVKLDDTAIHSV